MEEHVLLDLDEVLTDDGPGVLLPTDEDRLTRWDNADYVDGEPQYDWTTGGDKKLKWNGGFSIGTIVPEEAR